MANTKRNLMSAAVMAATLLTVSQAMAADSSIKTLVLHVDNFAQVSNGELRNAEKVATKIYAAAGITTVWVDGDSDQDSRDQSAHHLRVLLLSRDMSELKIKADRVADNVMGQALKATKRAYIFYPRISNLATTREAIVNDLLGKIMAHEVGHLILSSGHSDRGIMQANVELRPTVQPRFTDAQAAAIRGDLAATTSAN